MKIKLFTIFFLNNGHGHIKKKRMEYAEQGNGAGYDFKTERDESPFGKGSVG